MEWPLHSHPIGVQHTGAKMKSNWHACMHPRRSHLWVQHRILGGQTCPLCHIDTTHLFPSPTAPALTFLHPRPLPPCPRTPLLRPGPPGTSRGPAPREDPGKALPSQGRPLRDSPGCVIWLKACFDGLIRSYTASKSVCWSVR